MSNPPFDRPILNSPYEPPKRHWELDAEGQPTQKVVERRRPAEFISPIPKSKKRKGGKTQDAIVFDEGHGLSTKEQQYNASIINLLRSQVDNWRSLPNATDWLVTPETQRLLQHRRHHKFGNLRPFFCQIEAVETAIWLTEVAPHAGKNGKAILDHLADARANANPQLLRVALKPHAAIGKINGAHAALLKDARSRVREWRLAKGSRPAGEGSGGSRQQGGRGAQGEGGRGEVGRLGHTDGAVP